MSQILEQKGNKQSVANALHRKANKQDLKKIEDEFLKKSEYINKNIEKLMADIAKVNEESTKIITDQFENLFATKKELMEKEAAKVMAEAVSKQVPASVKKFFSDYALEIYGASVLEDEQKEKLTIKTVLDRVCDDKLKELQLETKYKTTFDQHCRKLESRLTEVFQDALKDEIE